MNVLRKIWRGWLRVGRAIGDIVARIVLTLLYFTLVLPFGLISTLLRDPLDLRPHTPGWLERQPAPDTFEEAGKLS